MEPCTRPLARTLRAAFLALVLGAVPARAQDPAGSPPPQDRRPLVVADTERDLFPDPHVLTCVRMHATQNLLRHHARAVGRAPASLAEFLPPQGPMPIDFWRDGWDTEFRYGRRDDDHWELRGAGADRQFGTADDDVLEGWRTEPAGADGGGAWRSAWREGAAGLCPTWSDPD
ncbi:MAG TPA: hypothetical protein VEQ60_10535 [Longimicrobium sp.]|nr:hypothetical protein [Longimicrobium sp.]